MIVIACVDNNMGMLFNHRRQSQDRVLRTRILEISKDTKLWLNAYSSRQFKEALPSHVTVAEDFLSKSSLGEFCFAENTDLRSVENCIEGIVLYRWNRDYPADTYFPLDLHSFSLQTTTEFPGSSHETITEEVYTR